MNEYSNNPETAAEFFVTVKKNNYLAHTIREIGQVIYSTIGKNYHILTRVSQTLKDDSKTFYHNRGCIINLPYDCEDADDKTIRLILAHELGHIIYNIDRLNEFNFVGQREALKEEEVFAWQFAYHLISKKSDELRKDIERKRYIYPKEEILRSLFSTVHRNMPEIYDDIKKIFGR